MMTTGCSHKVSLSMTPCMRGSALPLRSATTGRPKLHDAHGDERHDCAAELRRSVPDLAEDRLYQFRRAGRADRPHASCRGRRKEMGRRSQIPACAEFLHASARAGGAEAGHLSWLAAAW